VCDGNVTFSDGNSTTDYTDLFTADETDEADNIVKL
jgi:hypothetical protein